MIACGITSMPHSPAKAQLPQSLSVASTPATVSWPGQTSLRFDIRITTGGNAADFAVDMLGPSWRPGHFYDGPYSFEQARVIGPGEIKPVPIQYPLYGNVMPCDRGGSYEPNRGSTDRFRVLMPSNASSVVQIPATLGAPPLDGVSYGVKFSAYLVTDTDKPWGPTLNLGTGQFLGAVAPLVTGEKGAHIFIRSRGRKRRIRSNGSPGLIGTTSPPLRRHKIRLRALRAWRGSQGEISLARWNHPTSIRLGVARTDSQGRFQLPPREIKRRGQYSVVARYESRVPRIVSDWSCGPTFGIAGKS